MNSPAPAGLDDSGKKIIAIVVPCYNEEEMLGITVPALTSLLTSLARDHDCSEQSYVVFIDDGSRDATWDLIEEAAAAGPFRGLRLACNVGHQAALLAGLDYVTDKCFAAVSIDADLQDDMNVIPQMISRCEAGAQLVLGVRESREVDTWFKRNTALAFYRLMTWMGVDTVENHADFRLMSNKALRNLQHFGERNLFLRGLPPLLHKRVETVTYQRAERAAGETKYPLHKMLALAWNGITSFSIVPLRLITYTGAGVFVASLLMIAYALAGVLMHDTMPGWASVVIPLYLLGGLIMLSIGVVGEYIGKLFLETKQRPRFLIDTIVGEDNER